MELNLFYCWQGQTNKGRDRVYLRKCIDEVVAQINKSYGQFSIIIQESSEGIGGSPEVVSEIKNRIENCDIFIADISIVNPYSRIEKLLRRKRRLDVNNNVMYELGIAVKSIGDKQILEISNKTYGNPYENVELIPFDRRHNDFPLLYEYDKNRNTFIEKLENKILECAQNAILSRKNKFSPFLSLAEWGKLQSNLCPFQKNEYINSIINEIQNNQKSLRILGLSGTGKTRIVFEALQTIEINTLYYDCNNNDDINMRSIADKIFKDTNNKYILVIDNCSLPILRNLLKQRKDNNSQTKIITISNNPEEVFEDKLPPEECEYIIINTKELEEIVLQIIEKNGKTLTEPEKERILDFADGIPLMAVLLCKNIMNSSETFGYLSDKDLLNKLLNVEDEQDTILETLSLFKYLHYDNQACKVIKSNSITPLSNSDPDFKLTKFEKTFQKFSHREIIEKFGDYFTLRPKPLAIYLAAEWFNKCNKERLLNVVIDIQNFNDVDLIEALCEEIKFLGANPKAKELVGKIQKENAPFDSAKVITTNMGSRLFRSFVEVNPIDTIENLYRNISNLPVSFFKNIDDSVRRNLIWTLEKGCFYQPTFNKASKLMLKFALAENETYANNATNQFLHLFRVSLPGTEADLHARYELIKYCLSNLEFKELGFKAIDNALKIDSYYIGGAEKQGLKKLEHYFPTEDEKKDYWIDITKIIEKEIYDKGSFSAVCFSILANSLREFYRFNYENITLSLIHKIINDGKNDWDEMYDTLCLIRDYDLKIFHRDENEILSLITKLEKKDFLSRFIAVSDYKHNRKLLEIKPEESLKYFKNQYGELAQEFVETKQPLEQLTKIYETKYLNPIGFGERLAILLKDDDKKIKEIVDITIDYITQHDQYPQILIDFSKGITPEQFSYLSDKLSANEKLAQYLFPIMGCRCFSLKDIEPLFNISEKYPKLAFCFKDFWYNLPYDNWDNDENASIHFKKLSEFGIPGINAILYIIFAFNNETKSKYPNTLRIVSEIFSEIDLFHNEIDKNFLIHALKYLLSINNPKLAKHINLKFMDYLYEHKQNPFSIDVAYYRELYEILIKKYFDAIWNDLLIGLTSIDDKFIIFYKLKDLLGGHNSYGDKYDNNENNGIFFDSISCLQIKNDLDKSEVLQSRIMGISPTFNPDSEKTSFSESSTFLLENYTSNKKMLEEFISNMHTFSCFGSMAPYFQKCKYCMDAIINNTTNTRLKDWIKEQSSHLDEIIKNENKRDEEAKLLYE